MKRRRWVFGAAGATLVIAATTYVALRTTPALADAAWTGTWAVAPQSSGATFNQQTLRQIVRTSISGTQARIHLSNAFGSQPVTISDVHIAKSSGGSSIVASSDKSVT